MSSPVWFVKMLKMGFPWVKPIASLTRTPLLGDLLHKGMFADDNVTYLPQDHLIPIGEPVAGQDNQVVPSAVLEHFVERTDHIWIMDTCICRDGNKCEHFPRDLGCMFLGEPAEGINRKLGRKVSRDEALEHIARARDAGLVHMIGRSRIDSLWLNVHPAHRLLTICHCCPCCCLWRILPVASQSVSEGVHRMPGVELRVGEDCQACGECAEPGVCFVEAISLEDDRAHIADSCRGCGRCVEVCPNEVIELHLDNPDYIEQTIARINGAVDLR